MQCYFKDNYFISITFSDLDILKKIFCFTYDVKHLEGRQYITVLVSDNLDKSSLTVKVGVNVHRSSETKGNPQNLAQT